MMAQAQDPEAPLPPCFNIGPSTAEELAACPDPHLASSAELHASVRALESAGARLRRPLERAALIPAEAQGQNQDVFDYLQLIFGFQAGNIANQREHLVLLLANAQMRLKPGLEASSEADLSADAVGAVFSPLLGNYLSWAGYLNIKSNIVNPGAGIQHEGGPGGRVAQELDGVEPGLWHLCYCALFLLVWGEAANVRFMPECLCYIFHHMAEDLNHVLQDSAHVAASREAVFRIPREGPGSFLRHVIKPFYNVAMAEAPKPKVDEGLPHYKWRNYDDLNEFFWSRRAFAEIGWPPQQSAAYFVPRGAPGRRDGKQGYVEQRTVLNLFTGFDRMWILLIVGLQVLTLGAWAAETAGTTPWAALAASQDAVATLLTAFITWAFLEFCSALIEGLLQWRRLRLSSVLLLVRLAVRCVISAAWVVVFIVIYAMMWSARSKAQGWDSQAQSLFRYMLLAAAVFVAPHAIALLLFLIPPISRALESSNFPLLRTLTSGLQEPQFVGRGMREGLYDSLKYAIFWVLLMAAKFSFSYQYQIVPLVEPTIALLGSRFTYQLPVLIPDSYEYFGVVCLWAPVVVIYFMDILIWYSVFSAVVGFLVGVLAHVGEINNLKILVLRFRFLPRALRLTLLPPSRNPRSRKGLLASILPEGVRTSMTRFFERLGMHYGLLSPEQQDKGDKRWVIPWNEMIKSFREEDIISNAEVGMLTIPAPPEIVSEHSLWPAFLLSDQVVKAIGLCKRWRGSSSQALWRRLADNEFRRCAILECYDLLCFLLLSLVTEGTDERRMLADMIAQVDAAALLAASSSAKAPPGERRDFCIHFQISSGPGALMTAASALTRFLSGPVSPDAREDRLKLVFLVQQLHEVLVREVWSPEAFLDLEERGVIPASAASPLYSEAVQLPTPANRAFYGAARRLHSILTSQNALASIPRNLTARRRITFFCNSVFMRMPTAVPVHAMRSLCVLTPYFKEAVEYSVRELRTQNEDGVSTLLYLQSIYPDEWRNFEERIQRTGKEVWDVDEGRAVTEWASFRGQTLARTVRGMMYYHRALEVLAALDEETPAEAEAGPPLKDHDPSPGFPGRHAPQGSPRADGAGQEMPAMGGTKAGGLPGRPLGHGATHLRNGGTGAGTGREGSAAAGLSALASLKFTYVVSCQVFGEQQRKNTPEAAAIRRLMRENPLLRIAYVDTVAAGPADPRTAAAAEHARRHPAAATGSAHEQRVFSVLVKWDPLADCMREVYRVELPGPILIGEGKPENQNHAIIFTRGEALQAIDMNQDSYLEEALKVRNLLEEFGGEPWTPGPARAARRARVMRGDGPLGARRRRILGMREHVFTGAVSSLASFMSAQETTFVTLGQRVLANPLKVRMHYGHPDVFDRLWNIARGGVSKASKSIHVSEDIFAGFNCTLRGGAVSHHEYIQVGKGRDVGLNQISLFEAKVASGNGEQVLSRDVFRLGRGLDLFRSLSFYHTSVGFFVATALTALSTYLFLYGRCFLALSGIEASVGSTAWGQALLSSINQQLLVQVGILTAVPMLAELVLEKGLGVALWEMVLMLLQLAPIFFSFSLGTRSHYFMRTLMHGGAKYRSTGRGFVVQHESFAKHFRLYSRSHFNKGLELVLLLIVYMIFSGLPPSSAAYWLLAFSSWLLALAWMLSPFIFNPLGFDWLKCVDDWEEWMAYMWRPPAVHADGQDEGHSWEAWWSAEREHLRHTRLWGLLYEALLSLRFFLFQYALVYHLHLADGSTSLLVYLYSWVALLVGAMLYTLHAFIRLRFYLDKNLAYRSLEVILFLASATALGLFLALTSFSISDALLLPIIYLPTGWGLLQMCILVAAAFPGFESSWLWRNLVVPFARAYDILLGSLVFLPMAVLSWLPGVQDMQTRVLFNQGFSRNLQVSRILGVTDTTR